MKFFHSTLGFSLALSLASLAGAAVEVGRQAPDFTLNDTNGKSHTLSDYAGKTVVLEWVNLGCPFVRKHYGSHNMQSLQKKYGIEGVVWLSICSSAEGQQGNLTAAEWNREIEARGISSAAVLLDASGAVGHLYGAKTTPDMYVIDANGTLVYEGAIDSIRSTDQSDIARATNYVAAALDAVLAGKPVATPTSSPYGCGVKYRN